MEVGEEGDYNRYYYIYLSLHHQKDSCINMGSDESHFNVLLIVMDKVTSVQKPQLLKRGESKRNRTEVLLTSLTVARRMPLTF